MSYSLQEQEERIRSLQVKTTHDGSPTLFVPALNEHYHSVHGALQESRHVFIEAGLLPVLQSGHQQVRVFEVGFGIGLNALLALEVALRHGCSIDYHTAEAYPLPQPLTEQLGLEQAIPDKELHHYFRLLHQAPWQQSVEVAPGFRLTKLHGQLQDLPLEPEQYQVIFFDAFAPEKQPELWEEVIFRKMRQLLQPGGQLVTYCAKGAVKRAMRAAGLQVEALPGPPGKREMTRALRS